MNKIDKILRMHTQNKSLKVFIFVNRFIGMVWAFSLQFDWCLKTALYGIKFRFWKYCFCKKMLNWLRCVKKSCLNVPLLSENRSRWIRLWIFVIIFAIENLEKVNWDIFRLSGASLEVFYRLGWKVLRSKPKVLSY